MAEVIPSRPRRAAGAAEKGDPRPPRHLSPASKRLWTEVVQQWSLGPDGLALFANGLESRDAYEVCRLQIAADGPTFRTETGQIRAHPAGKLALDYLSAFRQTMRQLGLQPEE